ncbi:MAG: hypothetical protein IJM27_00775 [Eubacterium sp.]|nr:hypothetical protein [Eubacterium sp.]
MDLISIRKEITITFLSRQTACAVAKDNYTSFCYPKRIKLMRFRTRRFRVKDFGHFMTMHTKTPFGMELLTVSFMPGEGKSVPYLLIDIMTVGKKRTVFVEYYDCTSDHNEMSELVIVRDSYNKLNEYKEKPHWYVGERAPYSLIKCGSCSDDSVLHDMIIDSVKAYKCEIEKAEKKEDNLTGLSAFRDRMINEGNPSSSVLEKVFGKEGAADFFRSCVMPMDDTGKD